jgi:hypothetical protein
MCKWHGTYHWKNLNKGYNFALDLTSIEGMHKKLWASKVVGVPISGISGLPTWEPWDKMTVGCMVHGHAQRILLGGRWWLLSSLGWGESCESVFVCDSSVHQKCSNYTLTNLLFGLCRSVWIIDSLVTCCSPHPKVPTCPFALEMLRANEHAPIPYPSVIFTLGLIAEFIKEFGVRHCWWRWPLKTLVMRRWKWSLTSFVICMSCWGLLPYFLCFNLFIIL